MAEPQIGDIGGPSDGGTVGGHGIDVVEQEGLRTDLFDVSCDAQHDRYGSQRAHYTGRAPVGGDAQIDSVSEGYFVILLEGIDTADLKESDHVIGVLKSLSPVESRSTSKSIFAALAWEQVDSLEKVAGFSCGGNRIRLVVGEGLRSVMLAYWAEEEIDAVFRRHVRLPPAHEGRYRDLCGIGKRGITA